jgi:sirohydrochlorin cobaltochelatase
LLDQPHDYRAVAQALETELGPGDPDEPLVLVGHGTDHAAWAAYPALEQVAGRIMSRSVFVGTVEGEPSPEEVVDRVIREGFKRVCLMPFLLVAGVHFQEDLCGEEDSWKALFESRGVEVRLEPRGLGQLDAMLDIFCRHIAEALEVIPSQG